MKSSGFALVAALAVATACRKDDANARHGETKHECTKILEGGFCIELPADASAAPKLKRKYDGVVVDYDFGRVVVVTEKLDDADAWKIQLESIQQTGEVGSAQDMKTSELPTGGTLLQWRTEAKAGSKVLSTTLWTNVLVHRDRDLLWCHTVSADAATVDACKSLRFL
jgi:hypothetical protein